MLAAGAPLLLWLKPHAALRVPLVEVGAPPLPDKLGYSRLRALPWELVEKVRSLLHRQPPRRPRAGHHDAIYCAFEAEILPLLPGVMGEIELAI